MCRTQPGHLCFLPLSPGSSSAVAPRESRELCEGSRKPTFITTNNHASSAQTPTLHSLTTVTNRLNTIPKSYCCLQLLHAKVLLHFFFLQGLQLYVMKGVITLSGSPSPMNQWECLRWNRGISSMETRPERVHSTRGHQCVCSWNLQYIHTHKSIGEREKKTFYSHHHYLWCLERGWCAECIS